MTLEEIKVRNWLNRAFYAEKKLNALDMLIKQCKERAEGLIRCGQYNDKGRSDTALNGTESTFMKLAEIEQLYDKQRQELYNISGEISKAIALLHDNELETVLIHRYLLFHTIEQTAELMHYSPETVKRKQRKAIEKLTRYDPL